MWIFLIFCWFSKMFNIHLKCLENSESTAWNVIIMITNEKFLNQNSKATLVTSKIGPKIGIKISFALKSDLIQFSGLFLWTLNLLCYFGSKFFHLLSFLSHSRLYSLSFVGASNASPGLFPWHLHASAFTSLSWITCW